MNIPICVQECKDKELRERAIAIYKNGTQKEKSSILFDVIHTANSDEAANVNKQKITAYEEWLLYLSQ